MRRWLRLTLITAGVGATALALYTVGGWRDARADGSGLKMEVARLTTAGRGLNQLSLRQRALLLMVEDPAFYSHNGADFWTPGAGATTITQSLSKRLGFDKFTPGIRKFRQTGYAWGLETVLTKDEILTLFLDRSPFRTSDGQWFTGFAAASNRFFGKPLSALTEREFLTMIAGGVAPARMQADRPGTELTERVRRIERLVAGQCRPADHGDVMLEGCA